MMKFKRCIKLFTPPLVYILYSKLLNILKLKSKERFYKINNYEIILPPEHCLDTYQKQFNRYDKFLPEFSKYITDGVIIDIGANVGDTLYGIFQPTATTKYICIEPEPYFFSYLKKNTQRLPPSEQKRITLLNIAISMEDKILSFSREKGTARQNKKGTLDIHAKSIDCIVEELSFPIEEYKLIKIDTDGYDYDCILSGKHFFLKTSAAIFWENDFSSTGTFQKYLEAVKLLLNCGYTKFYIFDNYGDFITTTTGKDILYLLKYQLKSVTNIYYFDILACKNNNINFIDSVIESIIRNNKDTTI